MYRGWLLSFIGISFVDVVVVVVTHEIDVGF